MCHYEFRIRRVERSILGPFASQGYHFELNICLDGTVVTFASAFWSFVSAYRWALAHGYRPTWDTRKRLK